MFCEDGEEYLALKCDCIDSIAATVAAAVEDFEELHTELDDYLDEDDDDYNF